MEIIIPQTSFPAGMTQLMNQAIAGKTCIISLARWADESTSIEVVIQVSYDGGATYLEGGRFTSKGGSVKAKDGITELKETKAKYTYGLPVDHMIVSLIVSPGMLVTHGSITVN